MHGAISRTHLVVATLAIVVLAFGVLTWSQGAPASTQAATTGAKTQMDIVINSGQCDSAVQSKCTLGAGSSFTVQIVPSTIPAGGYAGWQTLLDYGSLLYKPGVVESEISWDIGILPKRAPSAPSGKEGSVGHFDVSAFFPDPVTGLLPVSLQKSALLTVNFNCSQNAGGEFSQLLSLIDFNTSPSGTTFVLDDKATQVPNTTSLTINCQAKQPDPGDTDQDGCSDQAENGAFEYLGGQRNFLYFWDFYDVWTRPPGDPSGWERNKVLNIFDINATGARFGPGPLLSKSDALAQALIAPTDATSYHPAYDRGPIIGANVWDRGPPDGSINIVDDILGIAQQFGHSCA